MAWQDIPIKYGATPDKGQTDPDFWDIQGAVPLADRFGTEHGYTSSTNGTMVGSNGVNACAELFTTNGTRRVMFGSASKLWQWNGVNNTATSDISGTTYGATTVQAWSFAQFGDNTHAVCKAAKVQRWTGTGNFADAATAAPKGSIIVNCGFPTAPQLMVFDYNDGTDYPDGWYCSALSSDTDWVNSIATGSASGRLLEPTGPITCAIPFRDGVIAFKKNAMFYGEYVGGDTVWSWRRLSANIGCIGKNAATSCNDLALALTGAAAGLALILPYERYLLLALAASAAVLYLVQRALVQQHKECKSLDPDEGIRRLEKRSLEAELVGVGVLSHAAPAAWIAVRGQIDRVGAELWALNLLFFLGGVLYVKYRVRGLQAHRSFATLRERVEFAWPVFLYHLALAAFLAGWVLVESRPAMLIAAFAPGILRACQLAVHLGQRFPIRRLGWSEVLHALLFAGLLVLAFSTAG